MSKYYNNYNNRNFKNKKHKKHNGKISSIISIVLIVFAILAVVGGLVALMRHDTQPNDDKVTVTTDNQGSNDVVYTPTTSEIDVYLDNTAEWAILQNPVVYYFDKTGKNEPNFVEMDQCSANDFTATIPAGYTHIIFLEYDESGTIGSWDNVLNQTSDLLIPTGSSLHYNLETNEWVDPFDA